MKVLFASGLERPEDWLPLLQEALPGERFVTEPAADVDVALVAGPPAGTFERIPNVKLVQSLWMGVERLLEDPALPEAPLARMVDPGMVAAMSETVLAHVLDWHRHHYRFRAYQKARQWRRHRQYAASDRTVGLLGLGELGSDAARKLMALGFKVAGWSRRPRRLEGIDCSTDLHHVLEKSDAIVCLLPLTPQTRGVLNRETLGKIRKGGCVVNVARGPLIVTADLIAALDSGQLAHAYLDVFDVEPLPQDSPLWTHPRVSVTPHMAALTDPRTAVPVVVENLERLRRGAPLLHLVDRTAGY